VATPVRQRGDGGVRAPDLEGEGSGARRGEEAWGLGFELGGTLRLARRLLSARGAAGWATARRLPPCRRARATARDEDDGVLGWAGLGRSSGALCTKAQCTVSRFLLFYFCFSFSFSSSVLKKLGLVCSLVKYET
jgi:hypothetical protein